MLDDPGTLPLFTGIRSARFPRVMVPGNVLDLALSDLERDDKKFAAHGSITVNGESTLEVDIAGQIRPVKELQRIVAMTQKRRARNLT